MRTLPAATLTMWRVMVEPPQPDEFGGTRRSLLVLVVVCAVAGVLAGLVGGAFRWLLERADAVRSGIAEWSHTLPGGVFVPVLLVALCAALAAAIVRLSPRAAGSGIQDVAAVVRGQVKAPPVSVLPARFAGGLLAIGGGLVLGREGPTVHMAAAIGATAARGGRLPVTDVRTAQSALAGAGLAVAFGAPIAGAVFVFEEITRAVTLRTALATLAAVGGAMAAAHLLVGDALEFRLPIVPEAPLHTLPLMAALGVVLGVLGAGYNILVVAATASAAHLRRLPVTVRAALIGALVGGALFVDPLMVGGGDALTQLLLAGHAVALPVLLLYLGVRFVAGPLSYAARTPGGLFAPLLALGALGGTAIAEVSRAFDPSLGTGFSVAMAVVGMSTMFAAVVRAPVTGIVVIIEMTGASMLALPMIVGAAAAVLTATMLRSRPVYDSLRELMVAGKP
ncbi:chloride channel protein [Microbacterium sp. SORGH_AS_0888]|uniref:chloride channel protein n=1 Tax=Microbacterium sp. SORGH_AS_0888 TaxID=3041791 RepID=UPI00278729A2|nr:chloride channel protein [Microbacterium sp. SORGH_AS_0888]MDQ1130812.1 CIC family chloride channel protein [Microbacterium sp. SORGH_AS_0888]